MLSPEEKSMCHPTATEHMDQNEEDTESDKGSLQWEEFFGSSLDLVPILLDMYDSLIAKNHEQDDQSSVPYPNRNRRASCISNQQLDLISRSESVPCTNDGEKKYNFEQHHQNFPNYSRRNSVSLNNFCKTHTLHEADGDLLDFNMCVSDLERTSCPSNSQNGTLDSGFMDQASLANVDPCNSQWTMKEDARPLSISSTSSSTSSSSSLTRHTNSKKSYLASIESLDDDEFSEDADEEKLLNNHANAFHPFVSPCHNRGPSVSLSYIDRVILEIIETERTYVKDTSEIIEGYLYFIRNHPELGISDDNINNLFGNIEVIYLFNKNFLKDLEQCGFDPVQVAHCFVTHNEGFTVYTHYCTNYPQTVSVLTELMRNPETAKIFRERQAILGHTLPLGSFLLKPVQRILKYHLLLQNIVKYYDPKQSGYEVIVNALATMTGMAHHINDMKRKHEHAVRVQEIQSLLYGWEGQDLTTYGELVAEGMFRVFGAKGIRHVFLFDKMLLIAKKKEGGFLSYKTHIMCSNLMLIESVPGEPLSFHVIPFDNPRVQYTLQARSLEQKREWTLQLKRVILENYDAIIPYHARQLVMQLGQNKTEEDVLIEKNMNTRRQHSAPEYLERRKNEKDRRKSEGGINRALKLRRGSKKSDADIQMVTAESRTRSSSRENKEKCESKKTNHCLKQKDKKYKGWRRKSEPTDFMSSKESLQTSQVNERMSNQGTIQEDFLPLTNSEVKSPTRFGGTYTSALTMFESFLHSNGKRKSPTRNNCFDRASSVGEPTSLTSPESVSISSLELDDPCADYVTFYFAQEHLHRNSSVSNSRTPYSNSEKSIESECSSLNSTVLCSPDSTSGSALAASSRLNKTSSFIEARTGGKCIATKTSPNSTLRRTQSFNHQSNSCLSLQEERRSFRARPNFLNLNGNHTRRFLFLKPEDQKQLDNEKRKSDSLPKSFQVNAEPPPYSKQKNNKKTKMPSFNSSRLKGPCNLSQSEFNIDDFEKFIHDSPAKQNKSCFPVRKTEKERNRSTGCSNTPSESLEDISLTFHPEHKIYRSSFSKTSLKNMLTNVSSRLANLKLGSSMSIDENSRSNLALDPDGKDFCRGRSRERTSKKLMCTVARMYSKMIKQRLRLKNDKDLEFGITVPASQMNLPFYKQGSPAIGARMASPIGQNDMHAARFRRPVNRRETARPDSVLSISSSITSSSDGDKTSGFGGSLDAATTPSESRNNLQSDDPNRIDNEDPDSDGSADSYYERSFEAIEGMLESEIFRDSAIYSDPDDMDLLSLHQGDSRKSTLNRKLPPPKPVKPFSLVEKKSFSTTTTPEFEHISIHDKLKGRRVRGQCIMERLKHLEKCTQSSPEDSLDSSGGRGFKSIKQRRKELELWQTGSHRDADESETSSQHSTSTINTVVEFPTISLASPSTTDHISMKGWVRHVVGKFQEKSKD